MAENLKSNTVTNLDALPVVIATAGEGQPGSLISASDYSSPTSSNASTSTYRLCRIPTTAKIKKVWLYTKGIDSNAAATATFDINLCFSDAVNDGTPTSLQGLIPTSSNNGTTTTVASYSSPNKLFGAAVAVANSGAAKLTDVTYTNTFTPANSLDDVWDVFGFTTPQGYAQDPGGFFDFLAYQAANSATAAAGTIGIECQFVK